MFYQGMFCVFCVLLIVQSSLSLNQGPCEKDDSACVTRTSNDILSKAINADSTLNTERLEPIKLDYVAGKLSIINYDTYNTTVVGVKDCRVVQAKLTLEKNSMSFKLICPNMYMYGVYKVSGKLLIVPIEGSGDYRIDTKDYHIDVDANTKLIHAKDGKEYLNLKCFKVNGDLQGGMVVDLKNLFNGQHKELAEAALKVANEQWKPVSKELQGPILDANVKKIVKNMNKYLKTVPLNQLFLH